nr:excalibur calcium-binding domain-containing protein [Rodentibacter pneumotropicus]
MKPKISISLITAFSIISSSSAFPKAKCSDFATQEEAQAYMIRYGATYLDRDRDGKACECLPGGSKYGSSVCNRR